ncbi:hypothetical protein PAHAL_8G117900 [Panicum hallii]|jgi:hypothetical protein|uniref:Uncharacterized protein n=1 Tax=Panicum hallii TaxID=206008 RepID=A0A2T8I8J1_9POAL|nr:hypothetical protein PAHAL_8G117900 [Panicum hallii]
MNNVPKLQSWPDLVGQHTDYATNVIHQDRPDLRVVGHLEGHDPEPEIEELDRVIIWQFIDTSFNSIVSRVPTQG